MRQNRAWIVCRMADGTASWRQADHPFWHEYRMLRSEPPAVGVFDPSPERITRLILVAFHHPGPGLYYEYHESPQCTGDPCDCPVSPARSGLLVLPNHPQEFWTEMERLPQ